YVKWRLKSEQQSNSTSEQQVKKTILAQLRCRTSALLLYCAGLLSAVLAMKTKEISFTLPIIIALYEFFFFNKSPNSELPAPNPQAKACGYTSRITHYASQFLFLLPFLLTLVIIPLNFIEHEWEIYKPVIDTEEKLRQLQLKDLASLSKYEYLLTQFRVIVTYIRLLFLPVNQNLDYDYPVYSSFFNPNVFLSFLFLLSIFGLAVYLFYYSKNPPSSLPTGQAVPFHKGGIKGGHSPFTVHRSLFTVHYLRLTAFGIFWFFITLSVESSVIPIEDIIFEHRVYLPSIGLIIAFVSAVFYIALLLTPYSSRFSLAACYLLLAFFVVVFSIAAYQRNSIWQDELSLWKDVVKKSPSKARGYTNLGYWGYYKQGQANKAINAYKIALKIDPNHINAYLNLGVAYFSRGEIDKAIQALQTSLRLKPDYLEAHKNLIGIYYKQGMYDEAIEEIRTTQLLSQNENAESYTNLGALYIKKNLPDKAIEYLNLALTINQHYAPAYNNLSIAYELKGQKDKADEYLKKAYSLGLDKYPKPFN
ncbi:MAG: tetratricopeptide repeat protein, partial [Nitrospirae bacterium]|nr:tetratricopeptide repeat protein [Nitrospirota bacterium]